MKYYLHMQIDPIISVLQLAAEAYRVRLANTQLPSEPQEDNPCDWNHNLEDVKEELRSELDKTDDLLQRLQQRLSHARSIHQTYDSSALRGVLTDMTTLLQQQQRLYRRVNDMKNDSLETLQHFHGNHHIDTVIPPTTATTTSLPAEESSSLLKSSTNVSSSSCCGDDDGEDVHHYGINSRLWLKSFERRLTAQIRKTIRQELRRVRPSCISARSKLKKSS
jgi:hypothetical protein